MLLKRKCYNHISPPGQDKTVRRLAQGDKRPASLCDEHAVRCAAVRDKRVGFKKGVSRGLHTFVFLNFWDKLKIK